MVAAAVVAAAVAAAAVVAVVAAAVAAAVAAVVAAVVVVAMEVMYRNTELPVLSVNCYLHQSVDRNNCNDGRKTVFVRDRFVAFRILKKSVAKKPFHRYLFLLS